MKSLKRINFAKFVEKSSFLSSANFHRVGFYFREKAGIEYSTSPKVDEMK